MLVCAVSILLTAAHLGLSFAGKIDSRFAVYQEVILGPFEPGVTPSPIIDPATVQQNDVAENGTALIPQATIAAAPFEGRGPGRAIPSPTTITRRRGPAPTGVTSLAEVSAANGTSGVPENVATGVQSQPSATFFRPYHVLQILDLVHICTLGFGFVISAAFQCSTPKQRPGESERNKNDTPSRSRRTSGYETIRSATSSTASMLRSQSSRSQGTYRVASPPPRAQSPAASSTLGSAPPTMTRYQVQQQQQLLPPNPVPQQRGSPPMPYAPPPVHQQSIPRPQPPQIHPSTPPPPTYTPPPPPIQQQQRPPAHNSNGRRSPRSKPKPRPITALTTTTTSTGIASYYFSSESSGSPTGTTTIPTLSTNLDSNTATSPTDSITYKSAFPSGTRLKVVSAYKAILTDEIPLYVGDIVQIQEAFEDGWAIGSNIGTGEFGVLPLGCCAEMEEEERLGVERGRDEGMRSRRSRLLSVSSAGGTLKPRSQNGTLDRGTFQRGYFRERVESMSISYRSSTGSAAAVTVSGIR
ncbi:hypothetical protein HK102_013198 [Quaeritorhiza haematococci]|nr:hypothetical protein HK102_013198 [Quaeritorhiza haematococci]